MFAIDLISNDTPQVRFSDSCGLILGWMDDFQVLHLPVFDGEEYIGLISQEALMDCSDDAILRDLTHLLLKIEVTDKAHLFDVVKVMNRGAISLIPVITNEKNFIGVIRFIDIIKFFGASSAVIQPGALLELQMVSSDYSMTDIARIIEGNDAKILFSNVVPQKVDNRDVTLYLKLNTVDIGGVLQTFSRYDYKVRSSVQNNEFEEDLKDRFDSLMNYLNM